MDYVSRVIGKIINNFNVGGLREYLINNVTTNEAEIYHIIFENQMNENIGLCITNYYILPLRLIMIW